MQTLAKQGTQHCGADRCLFNFVKQALNPTDIGNRLRHITWQSDQLVYQQGEPAYNCYWLCQGQIKLARRTLQGKQQIIRFAQPGQLFGLEALGGRESYDYYAQALEASKLVAIGRRSALLTLLTDPAFAMAALSALADEFLEVEERFKLFFSGSALQRITQALLTVASEQQTEAVGGLKLTNELLAAMAGTSPQTVSKCLGKLQRRGLITHRWGRITLVAPAQLATFYDGVCLAEASG